MPDDNFLQLKRFAFLAFYIIYIYFVYEAFNWMNVFYQIITNFLWIITSLCTYRTLFVTLWNNATYLCTSCTHTLCWQLKIYKFETTFNYDTLFLLRKWTRISSISVKQKIILCRKLLLFLEIQFMTYLRQWFYSVIHLFRYLWNRWTALVPPLCYFTQYNHPFSF
jgi:hypothetical protein